jgi:hypothetical protein
MYCVVATSILKLKYFSECVLRKHVYVGKIGFVLKTAYCWCHVVLYFLSEQIK